jgi:hypothetical protein
MSTAVRMIAVGSLTALTVACGEAEKDPDAKAIVFNISVSQKDGPSMAALSGNAFTFLAGGVADKSAEQLVANQNHRGALTSGMKIDIWHFTLEAATEVSVSVSSGDFDTVLDIYGDNEIIATNDDADGTNSALTVTLKPGQYGAFVRAYGGSSFGSYEIQMDVEGGGSSGGGSRDGQLRSGGPTLEDGSLFEDWAINGRSGDQFTVTMESSDFDTYLILLQNGAILTSDDDGAGGTNSQINYTLPSTGAYTVRANSFGADATGSYTISMGVEEGRDAVAFSGFGSGGDPNGRYALLVGIDDYPGTGSDLRGPVEDARIMELVLVEKYGFDPQNVVTLNDSEATRVNIAQGVAQHLGQAGPDGVAVFFYSGHGTQIGENIGLTGALDPEPRGEGDEALYIYGHTSESSVLLDEELGFLMETLQAGRSLVVVDACFSGEITRGSGDAPQSKVVDLNDPEIAGSVVLPTDFISSDLKALDLYDMSSGFGDFDQIAEVFRNPQRHIAWGSSTEDQVSWTSSLGNGASVFAYYVGERMMSSDASTTFGDVQRLVHDDVVRYIKDDGNMTMQNPSLRGPNQNMTLADFFRQR